MLHSNPTVAVIDLGTNTFHLLIGRFGLTQIEEVYQLQLPVKIGQGGINKGFITTEAQARAFQALTTFSEKIKEFNVSKIIAIGTSAIRNASNGDAFLSEIKQQFGFNTNKIQGNKEAELIYKGVLCSFSFPSKPTWVMDIGGGSVEFILGQEKDIIWRKSFEIGAARLIEKFNISEAITKLELQKIDDFFETNLKEVWQVQLKYQANWFVGSAGSFDTLREVLQEDLQETLLDISEHAQEVSMAQVEKFSEFILGSNLKQRQQMKGLPDFRVDMIVAATALMNFVVKRLGSNRIIASHYALKEGILATFEDFQK
jgi:exopolyphosphatase/guanosine-5'-triphosphate,3'-diphosphate pyrophosphatase